jgi:hypothetical protein
VRHDRTSEAVGVIQPSCEVDCRLRDSNPWFELHTRFVRLRHGEVELELGFCVFTGAAANRVEAAPRELVRYVEGVPRQRGPRRHECRASGCIDVADRRGLEQMVRCR